MKRRLVALAAVVAVGAGTTACSTITGGLDDAFGGDDGASAGQAAGSGGSGDTAGADGTGGADGADGSGAEEDLPPMSGSLEELLVEPSAMPELTFLVQTPEDDTGGIPDEQVPPEEQPRTEPAECAPDPAEEQRESAHHTWVDDTKDAWYQLHMFGQDVGLDNFDSNIDECPQYTTFYADKAVDTTMTRIDGPRIEDADVRAADMTTTTHTDGEEPRTLHSSAYMAEVRGVTFFVQLTVHSGEEISPEQRRLMDQLFEAQVRQLRYAG